jgi:hypothetical protein
MAAMNGEELLPAEDIKEVHENLKILPSRNP